jgi:hypothetical protein
LGDEGLAGLGVVADAGGELDGDLGAGFFGVATGDRVRPCPGTAASPPSTRRRRDARPTDLGCVVGVGGAPILRSSGGDGVDDVMGVSRGWRRSW